MMGLSDAYLAMIWDEIERNALWDIEAYVVRNALMLYDGL